MGTTRLTGLSTGVASQPLESRGPFARRAVRHRREVRGANCPTPLPLRLGERGRAVVTKGEMAEGGRRSEFIEEREEDKPNWVESVSFVKR